MTQKEILAWSYRGVSAVVRFWRRVKRRGKDQCWWWTGSINRGGYGMLRIADQHIVASRAAWIITNGDIPDGQYVLHLCDNPSCCNPRHQFLGTYGDNNLDARLKGRWIPSYGERIGTSKLTATKVRLIRKLFGAGNVSKAALGRRFGVTDVMIGKIVRREWWKRA